MHNTVINSHVPRQGPNNRRKSFFMLLKKIIVKIQKDSRPRVTLEFGTRFWGPGGGGATTTVSCPKLPSSFAHF